MLITWESWGNSLFVALHYRDGKSAFLQGSEASSVASALDGASDTTAAWIADQYREVAQ